MIRHVASLAAALALVATPGRAVAECVQWDDIVVFIGIDMSGSMEGPPQIDASAFGVAVIDELQATGHLDEAGAVWWCGGPVGFICYDGWDATGDIAQARDLMASLAYISTCTGDCGGTKLYDAIFVLSGYIYDESSSATRLFVILTDGEDTGSDNSAEAAAAALTPGVYTWLIRAGSVSSSPQLDYVAGLAGSHVESRGSTFADLDNLVSDIVDRACSNWRPTAAFNRSPGGDLTLGTGGFTMSFDGSPSSDPNHSDASLDFAWRLTGPGGATFTGTGMSYSPTFTDDHIGPWTARLTVEDPAGSTDTEEQTFHIVGVPPSISLAGPGTIDALELLQVSASPTTDVDGGNLEFTWEVLEAPLLAEIQPPGPLIPWTTPTISFVTTETDITMVAGSEIGRWRFRCTAEDDEGETDSAEITVHVRNLPPEIDLIGPDEVDVGEPIEAETTITTDQDGGDLILEWELVQVPASAGLPVPHTIDTGASLFVATGPSDAGTWIVRLHARDNEGEEIEEDLQILVDAPPEAALTGPDFGGAHETITLSSADSVDPDSPCPDEPDGCHLTDGSPAIVSPGIVERTWTLIEVPSDADPIYFPGRVDEALGLNAHGEMLELPPFTLEPGTWVFQVEVVDGEGNSDYATFALDVIAPDTPPLAITIGPRFVLTDASRVPATDVVLDGHYSFDLDNLLDGEPFSFGMGITAYEWSALFPVMACTFPAAAAGATVPLALAGVPIPPECFAWHRYQLAVTDDDPSPLVGFGTQDVILSDCDTTVCIESPTHEQHEDVAFSDQTEVLIGYYLSGAVYDTPLCQSGCYAALEIVHESDLATPVFTAWDPNPLGTTRGATQFFSWNGRVVDPVTGQTSRPLPGKYTTTIEIVDFAFGPASTPIRATEAENIWIQVADPAIDPTSDQWLSLNAARAGTDALHVEFEIAGGIPITATVLRVFAEGSDTAVAEVDGPAASAGTIEWNGEIGSGVFIDPGHYEVALEAIGGASVLGVSPRHAFTAYRIDLIVAGTDEADEEIPGVPLLVSTAAADVRVVLEPDGLPGELVLTELGPGVLGPPAGAWIAGGAFPASAAFPELLPTITVEDSAPAPVTLQATYLPDASLALAKEALDEVSILAVQPDLTARCSDDAREDTTGIFVARRIATGPVDPLLEAPMLRSLDLSTTHVFGGARLVLAEGAATTVTVLAPPAPATAAVPVVLPYDIPAAFVAADESLDTKVELRGMAHGTVELALELDIDGTFTEVDRVKVRVGDPPRMVGVSHPVAPHWYTLAAVNAGAPMSIAIDPLLHDERRGLTAHVHVVAHKDAAAWAADPSLVDLTGSVETHVVTTAPGTTVADNVVAVWPAAAVGPVTTGLHDVVLDFGDCSPGAAPDGTLGPEDLIYPVDRPGAELAVIPDFSLPGPKAVTTVEYGNDFEDGNAGPDCTPAELLAGPACTPGPGSCPGDAVCVDDPSDGAFHCTPLGAPCGAGTVCVNTDDDEDAHCRPAPERITIPAGYDGLIGAPAAGEFRLRGRIVHPPLADGPYPLVVIAHGRHMPYHVRVSGGRWQAADVLAGTPTTSDQNYRGHDDVQRHLASHGIMSVSIDLDEAIGFVDTPMGPISVGYPDVPTGGIRLRGWLILKNLEHVLAMAAIGPAVDTARVHLLGHSRGGEAVLSAWWIRQDKAGRGPASVAAGPDTDLAGAVPATFASVVSVAPTTFRNDAPPTGTRPFFLLYGSADGDVNGWNPPGVRPMGHPDRATGERAVLVVAGANHNFFNTSWSSDDFTGGTAPSRITDVEQRALLRAYTLAWVRHVAGEQGAGAVFRTPPSRLRPLGIPPAQLWTEHRPATGALTAIEDHQANFADPAISSSGGAVVPVLATIAGEPVLVDVALADDTVSPNRFMQETRGGVVTWPMGPAQLSFLFSGGATDIRAFRSLSLRIAPEPNLSPGAPAFAIRLLDGAANTVEVPSDFVTVIPSTWTKTHPNGTDTTIAFFQTVRVDIDRFLVGATTFDPANVVGVALVFASPAGRYVIDDVELEP